MLPLPASALVIQKPQMLAQGRLDLEQPWGRSERALGCSTQEGLGRLTRLALPWEHSIIEVSKATQDAHDAHDAHSSTDRSGG